MADSESPNLTRLKELYAGWSSSRGASYEHVLALMDEDVEMLSVLDPALDDEVSGTHRGLASARIYFETLGETWQMLAYDVDRFIDGGDEIVMVGRCHYRHIASGREIDSPKVDIWTFRDGRAVGFFELFDSLGFARAIGAVTDAVPSPA